MTAKVSVEPDGQVRVWMHTQTWRSRSDADLHNTTLKTLKARFGGGFHSDNGSNAYLDCWRPYRHGAEGACYKAYAVFEGNYSRFEGLLASVKVDGPDLPPGFESLDPRINLSDALLPYLTSIAEEYLRSTYIGLLKYSPRKAAVLRTQRGIGAEELARVSDGTTTVEAAVAQALGFQTLDRVVSSFHDVDPVIGPRSSIETALSQSARHPV